MFSKIIKVDFQQRRVCATDDEEKHETAEEDQLLDDLLFYKSEENQQLLRRACIQGLGLMKSNSITERDVLESRKEEFRKTSLKLLCDLILGSDPTKWPSRPNYYGAAVVVLRARFKSLYKVGSEMKQLFGEQI